MLPLPLQFIIAMVAYAINRQMDRRLEYLLEEVRVLREVYTETTGVPSAQVSGISSAAAIADFHAWAILNGDRVQCWGANSYGELGNGTTANSSVPMTVNGF